MFRRDIEVLDATNDTVPEELLSALLEISAKSNAPKFETFRFKSHVLLRRVVRQGSVLAQTDDLDVSDERLETQAIARIPH